MNVPIYFDGGLLLLIAIVVVGVWIVLKHRLTEARLIHQEGHAKPEYTPPDNLRPIELGLLYDRTLGVNELSSILFFLVHLGAIGIVVNRPKRGLNAGSYTLTRSRTVSDVRPYEHTFLQQLFATSNTVEWRDYFERATTMFDLGRLIFEVQQELQRLGYCHFADDYLGLSFDQALSSALRDIKTHPIATLKSMSTTITRYITPRGQAIVPHIVAYCDYLRVAEKERVAFHTDPAGAYLYVDEHFPYALALGVNPEWGSELMGARRTRPQA